MKTDKKTKTYVYPENKSDKRYILNGYNKLCLII